MKIMFLAIPLAYVGANAYLYLRVIQALSALPLWARVIATVLFWLVAFALFAAIGLRESQLPDWTLRSLFTTGSVWMVFLLYCVLLLAVADLAKLAIPSMGHTIWYALPATCLLLAYGYIHYRNPKVEHIEVATDRSIDSDSLRLVVVSDIHLGYGTGVKTLERYVELINSQQPDAVLIAGDLIDNSLKPILQEPFDRVLATIKAPQGIYMVPGNHEYISDIDKVANYIKNTPITLLRDSIATLPGGVQIVGRDDRSNRRRKPLAELMEQTDKSHPTVVLDHQPYHLAKADSLQVDLLLCGHTHHGQVFPFNLLTDHMYEQAHGYRQWGHTHVWVSSGLSLWGPPFRIGTSSDLAVITIRPKH